MLSNLRKMLSLLKKLFCRSEPIFHDDFLKRIDHAQENLKYADNAFLITLLRKQGPNAAESFFRHHCVQERAKPLLPHESAAATLLYPKTAAILYDRIWAGVTVWEPMAPLELLFPTNDVYCLCFVFENDRPRLQSSADISGYIKRNVEHYEQTFPEHVFDLKLRLNRRITPILGTQEGMRKVYRPGDKAFLVVAIEKAPFINESSLTWDVVSELRRDKEARKSIQSFHKWADSEFVGKEVAEIIDVIHQRSEAYKIALKKHGQATRLTYLELIYDWNPRLKAAGLYELLQAGGFDKMGSAIAASSLAVGEMSLKIAKQYLERTESHEKLKGEYSEVAFLAKV